MKKSLIIVLIFLNGLVFAQAPHLLNYQGVARDASNNIVTSLIGLKFEIVQGSTSGTVVYSESNSATPSTAGIFTAKIGGGTPSIGTFSLISWATGPYFVRVSIDPAGGSSYSVVGTSQLLSVPYALYAEKAGSGALPTGTLTGQTLYWDNPGSKWVADKNILNNGSQVVVGDPLITGNNKMKIVTYSSSDSSALFVYHPNSLGNQSAVRGFASGASVNSGSLNINPIMGGHFIGYNTLNNGSAVGAVGQGISPGGDAIGVIAVGTSSSNISGKSVGLYASGTGPTYINNYAAIFDRGKVFVNDTLIINTNGSIGDVLTRGINGKAHWQAPGAGAGPWQRTLISGNDNVHLQNNNDLVNIGLPTGISANEKLHVHNITGDAYINLSTSLGSNNVGLVFGESSNISKAFLAFDNSSNSLTYRHFSKRVFFIDGSSKNFFFGPKIPLVATSSSAFNIFDSVSSTAGRPILRIVNMAGVGGNNPTSLFLGDNVGNGLSIAHDRQGTIEHFHVGNTNSSVFYHTFTSTGEFYPGSNGSTTGLSYIKGGATNTSDLLINGPSLANIVFDGHLKGAGPAPSVAVATSGTNLSAFPFTVTLGSSNSNDIKGSFRAVLTFSTVFNTYSTSSDELTISVTYFRPYSNPPTVVVSPVNDILGLTYFTTNMAGNTGFILHVRNQSTAGVPVNSSYPFEFNYIVIE